MFKIVILLVSLIALVLSAPAADNLVITLPDGQVQGATYFTPNNVTYFGWRGIPFATPPVGNLRFEAPQPPQPWTGVLDATQDRNNCLSTMTSGNQNEDCLYINVYTPSTKPAEKLPVMFWIYGGGFQIGGADKSIYGPDYFIEEDVIIVTSNYRVGPMGFLSTGDTAIRGNAGLKDQVLAMEWTKNNIALFGGDPEKVTIFGQSAGGQSVGLHLISKKSAGLFRGAIAESGSGMVNSSASLNPEIYAFQLAGLIPGGNYRNNTQKLADFLKNCSGADIINAAASITGQDQSAWPVVEVEGEDAFLSEYPYVLYETASFNKVPAIMGICAEEGLENGIAAMQKLATLFDADPKKLIPQDLRPDPSNEDIVAATIKSFYLEEGATFTSNLTGAVKFQSDNKFARALRKNAELHSKYASVYVYQFAYSTTAAVIDGVESAGHGAELDFLFYSAGGPGPGPHLRDDRNGTDLLVQNRIVRLWANFAKFLNPTPEKTELLENVIWPSVTPSNMQYLNMNASLEVRQDLKGSTYPKWNETYYSYGAKPFVTF